VLFQRAIEHDSVLGVVAELDTLLETGELDKTELDSLLESGTTELDKTELDKTELDSLLESGTTELDKTELDINEVKIWLDKKLLLDSRLDEDNRDRYS
jgi:hypothetical protein